MISAITIKTVSTTRSTNQNTHHKKDQDFQNHLGQLTVRLKTVTRRMDRQQKVQRDVVEKHKKEVKSLPTPKKRKRRLVNQKSS